MDIEEEAYKPLSLDIENLKATLESLMLEGLPDEYLASQLSAIRTSNQTCKETVDSLKQKVIGM